MDNNKMMADLIRRMSGRSNVLVIQRVYIDICDEHVLSALALSQMIYWSDRSKLPDGWFYKQYSEWQEEIGVKERSMRNIVYRLKSKGFIDTAVRLVGMKPTLHIRVNIEKILEAIFSNVNEIETSDSTETVTADFAGSIETCIFAETETADFADSLTETTYRDYVTDYLADEEKIETDLDTQDIDVSEDQRVADELLAELQEKKLATPARLPKKRTSEDHRNGVIRALEKWDSNNKDTSPEIAAYLGNIPENIRPLAREFCLAFGRAPTKTESLYWLEGFLNQYELGVSPEYVKQAIQKMINEGLTIKSPASITAVAENIKLKSGFSGSVQQESFLNAAEVWTSERRIR